MCRYTEKLFSTTEEEKAKIPAIAETMIKDGLSKDFVEKVVKVAEEDQGAFDLMEMWLKENVDRLVIQLELKGVLKDYGLDK